MTTYKVMISDARDAFLFFYRFLPLRFGLQYATPRRIADRRENDTFSSLRLGPSGKRKEKEKKKKEKTLSATIVVVVVVDKSFSPHKNDTTTTRLYAGA